MVIDPQGTRAVDYWLRWLGIDHLKEMYPAQLSRGQRQRAAIARTLVLEPDLLLMDEPFSALDAPIKEELQKVMNSFHQESGLTSLTVTHDIEEAVVLGEKILVLSNSCNRVLKVIDNHLSGKIDKRNDPDFLIRCAELRQLLASRRRKRQLRNSHDHEEKSVYSQYPGRRRHVFLSLAADGACGKPADPAFSS